MRKIALCLLLLCGTSAMAAKDTIIVTRVDMENDWPFAAEKATLSCVKKLLPVAEVNGKKYGLSGVAKGMGYAQLTPDNPVWLDSNLGGGVKASLMGVTDRARELCK